MKVNETSNNQNINGTWSKILTPSSPNLFVNSKLRHQIVILKI